MLSLEYFFVMFFLKTQEISGLLSVFCLNTTFSFKNLARIRHSLFLLFCTTCFPVLPQAFLLARQSGKAKHLPPYGSRCFAQKGDLFCQDFLPLGRHVLRGNDRAYQHQTHHIGKGAGDHHAEAASHQHDSENPWNLFIQMAVERGGNAEDAWQHYLIAWDKLVQKYSKKD